MQSEGVATPDAVPASPTAVPAPTPLPSDTPTPTPVPPFPSIPTPTPTSAPMPTATPASPPGFAPLPEAELSIEFDSAALRRLARNSYGSTLRSPTRRRATLSASTLAFEVFGALEADGPAEVFHAHVHACEESTCDLGSFDGFESVTGYVIVHAKPGTYAEFTVDADLCWLVRNLDTWHSYDRAIVNVVDIDDPRAPMWATGVGVQTMSCGESVHNSERVYMAFGRYLYSFAKSDGEELWEEFGDAWHFLPVVAGDSVLQYTIPAPGISAP